VARINGRSTLQLSGIPVAFGGECEAPPGPRQWQGRQSRGVTLPGHSNAGGQPHRKSRCAFLNESARMDRVVAARAGGLQSDCNYKALQHCICNADGGYGRPFAGRMSSWTEPGATPCRSSPVHGKLPRNRSSRMAPLNQRLAEHHPYQREDVSSPFKSGDMSPSPEDSRPSSD